MIGGRHKPACAVGLIVLVGFIVLPSTQSAAQKIEASDSSARAVLKEFCESDARGSRLTVDGWRQSSRYFASPTAPDLNEIIVVRDFALSNPSDEKNSVGFFVEYIYLGRVDKQGRYTDIRQLELPSKVRVDFKLVLMGKGTRKGWKISSSEPSPHITARTAIDFLTKLRQRTTDPKLRKNAERSILALRRELG